MVIHARPLTIKGGNIELKQLKNELTRNVMSGADGESVTYAKTKIRDRAPLSKLKK